LKERTARDWGRGGERPGGGALRHRSCCSGPPSPLEPSPAKKQHTHKTLVIVPIVSPCSFRDPSLAHARTTGAHKEGERLGRAVRLLALLKKATKLVSFCCRPRASRGNNGPQRRQQGRRWRRVWGLLGRGPPRGAWRRRRGRPRPSRRRCSERPPARSPDAAADAAAAARAVCERLESAVASANPAPAPTSAQQRAPALVLVLVLVAVVRAPPPRALGGAAAPVCAPGRQHGVFRPHASPAISSTVCSLARRRRRRGASGCSVGGSSCCRSIGSSAAARAGWRGGDVVAAAPAAEPAAATNGASIVVSPARG